MSHVALQVKVNTFVHLQLALSPPSISIVLNGFALLWPLQGDRCWWWYDKKTNLVAATVAS